MISGIILAYILSWFGFIKVAQAGMLELFNISISVTTYYFIFAMLGFIYSLFRKSEKFSE